MRTRFALATFGLFALGCNLAPAQDNYPNRTVTLTIGFAAGGNGDIITRIVAEGLSPRLGQPVVVDSREARSGKESPNLKLQAPNNRQ